MGRPRKSSSELLDGFLREARDLWKRGDAKAATERAARVFLAEGRDVFGRADEALLAATLKRLKPPAGFQSWEQWFASEEASAEPDTRTDDEVVEELERKSGKTRLHDAVESGDLAAVERLLREGADANAIWDRGGFGWTPLSAAVHGDHAAIVTCLLAAGAKTRQRGARPPMLNVESVAVAKLLLDAGADLRARDDLGRFPLATVIDLQGPLDLARFLAGAMGTLTRAEQAVLTRVAEQSTPRLRALVKQLTDAKT